MRIVCTICDGKGTTPDTKRVGCALVTVNDTCDLCDGKGSLPAEPRWLALRYKRKAATMTTEIRRLRRTIDSHHSGKG